MKSYPDKYRQPLITQTNRQTILCIYQIFYSFHFSDAFFYPLVFDGFTGGIIELPAGFSPASSFTGSRICHKQNVRDFDMGIQLLVAGFTRYYPKQSWGTGLDIRSFTGYKPLGSSRNPSRRFSTVRLKIVKLIWRSRQAKCFLNRLRKVHVYPS